MSKVLKFGLGPLVILEIFAAGCGSPASRDASLASLAVSSGVLNPDFASDVTTYRLVVPFETTSLNVTPTAGQANATLRVSQDGGSALRVANGTNSAALTVPDVGSSSLVRVQVTAEAGSTTRTYDVVVTRAASSTASLSALTASAAELTPGFSPAVTSYSLTVPFSTSRLTLTPTAADSGATITVTQDQAQAVAVASGNESDDLMVPPVGAVSLVRVRVTAQDATTSREYSLLVRRTAATDASLSHLRASAGTLSPSFLPAVTSYALSLGSTPSGLTVTPTAADSGATITVAQDNAAPMAVASGSPSGPITVPAAGTASLIRVRVTAQDGTTTREYVLVVSRVASGGSNLSTLTASTGTLSPAFDPSVTSYTLAVPFAASTLRVTPTTTDSGATITIAQDNGVAAPVASGSASASLTVPAVGLVSLVRVRVTAPDGITVRDYALLVRRTAATTATLSGLLVSVGALNPTFDSGVTSYALVVPSGPNTFSVTPTAADSGATITVTQDNGPETPLPSGTASAALAVPSPGVTSLVRVHVTAQDGTTVQVYALLVSRTTATDSSLSALTASVGALSPTFTPGRTAYALSLPFGTSTVTLTPTASNAAATLTLAQDGAPPSVVTSGVGTALSVQGPGLPSVIRLVVTAQDGIQATTYNVTVTEATATDASLAMLTDSAAGLMNFAPGTLTYSFSVPSSVTSLTVTPTATDPQVHSITVNQVAVASGASSGPIVVNSNGPTVIAIVVVSGDQTKSQTYTLTITQTPASSGLLSPRTVPVVASTPLAVASGALLPANGATGVPVDTLLRIGFDATPSLGVTGTISIVRASDGVVVDTIDLSDVWAVYSGPDRKLVANVTSTKVNVIGALSSGTDFVRVVNYLPVMVSGNTVTIYPHNNKLSYNTRYHVLIDSGVVSGAVSGVAFDGVTSPTGWTFTTRTSAPTTFNVAADNSADFATVQGAIDAVPVNNTTPRTINIAAGVYQELLFIRQKDNLTLKGADSLSTVIQYDTCDGFNPGVGVAQAVTAPGPNGSIPTTGVVGGGRALWYLQTADNVVLDSITVKNLHGQGSYTLPDGTGFTPTSGPTFQNYTAGVQAEALFFDTVNSRLTVKHSNFVSFQDTLQLKGYVWMYDCFVTGDTDFIWGYPYAAVFERCEIKSRANPNGSSVVQSRAYANYAGFVFLSSALTKESGAFTAFLARSPGASAGAYQNDLVAFVNCSMDTHIPGVGWNVVGGNPTTPNQRATAVSGWREYQSRSPSGALLNVSSRLAQTATVNGSIQLVDTDVTTFFPNRATILSGATNGALTTSGYAGGWSPVP